MVAQKMKASLIVTLVVTAGLPVLEVMKMELAASIMAYAAVTPLLVYLLLGEFTRTRAGSAGENTEPKTSSGPLALLNQSSGMSASVQTILDACDRLTARSRDRDPDGRIGQEATAIRSEAKRLSNALSRATRPGPRGPVRTNGAG